jgi:hypothetical protein
MVRGGEKKGPEPVWMTRTLIRIPYGEKSREIKRRREENLPP